jgi:hypothetical protein
MNRDVSSMIISFITSLYFDENNNLEHVVDEVNVDWYNQCVLKESQLRSDLVIDLFSSAFIEKEIDKLKKYTSINNWTQITLQMFFLFLMCEIKCDKKDLDIADRQNMHNCNVVVKVFLKIKQKADKYRQKKEIEKKTKNLSEQILVFFISHDQQNVRFYEHYVIIQKKKWTYYRYRIRKFDFIDNMSRDKTTGIFERVKIEADHHTSLRMRPHHVTSRLASCILQFVKLDRWESLTRFLHYSYYHHWSRDHFCSLTTTWQLWARYVTS